MDLCRSTEGRRVGEAVHLSIANVADNIIRIEAFSYHIHGSGLTASTAGQINPHTHQHATNCMGRQLAINFVQGSQQGRVFLLCLRREDERWNRIRSCLIRPRHSYSQVSEQINCVNKSSISRFDSAARFRLDSDLIRHGLREFQSLPEPLPITTTSSDVPPAINLDRSTVQWLVVWAMHVLHFRMKLMTIQQQQ